ncbi:PQQ-binding-like beta-propeller repeat protein [Phytomonospora sp. NPDC050363]|uniref:outer membrane protein assembly factor BamB family protein n=1 Tax=Phytomonospora sp. NPDC050363 TaxID=3155642 RepID=UPI0033F4D2DF
MRRLRPHRTAWVLGVVAAVIAMSAAAAIWITTLSATAAEPEIDWRHTLAAQQQPPDAVAAGGFVLVLADRTVTALDEVTGEQRWQIPEVDGPVRVTVDAVVLARGPRITVYDLTTGAERFTYEGELGHNPPVFAVSDDTLYTAERVGKQREVVATSLTDAERLWHRRYAAEVAVAAPVLPDPVDQSIVSTKALRLASSSPVVYVNIGLREDGDEKTVTLDAETGDTRGRPETLMDLDTYPIIAVHGERVATVGKHDGCTTDVTVYDPASGGTETVAFGADCEAGASIMATGDVLLGQNVNGFPQVVDSVTGGARWTALEAGTARAFRDPVVAYSPVERDESLMMAEITGAVAPWSAEDTAPPSGKTNIVGDLLLSSTGAFPSEETPDATFATTAYNLGIDKLMWYQPGARLVTVTDEHLILALTSRGFDDLKPATLAAVPF